MSGAIPRRQKFAKWPPRVRPQRILPERANAELHCLEVLASAPFEGLQWNPPAKFIFRPLQKLFSAWSACFQRISPPSLPPVGSVYRPPRNWLVGQRTAGQTMHSRGRERAREGGLENYLRENTKAPNVGRTDDGAESNIPLEIQVYF